jgi:hypothetical protein
MLIAIRQATTLLLHSACDNCRKAGVPGGNSVGVSVTVQAHAPVVVNAGSAHAEQVVGTARANGVMRRVEVVAVAEGTAVVGRVQVLAGVDGRLIGAVEVERATAEWPSSELRRLDAPAHIADGAWQRRKRSCGTPSRRTGRCR